MEHPAQLGKPHFINHSDGFLAHQALHGGGVVVGAGVVVVVKRPPQSCAVRPDSASKPTRIKDPLAFLYTTSSTKRGCEHEACKY